MDGGAVGEDGEVRAGAADACLAEGHGKVGRHHGKGHFGVVEELRL